MIVLYFFEFLNYISNTGNEDCYFLKLNKKLLLVNLNIIFEKLINKLS